MKLQNIILGILGIAILYFFFFSKMGEDITFDDSKETIDSLNNVIQSEKKSRKELDIRISQLQDSLDIYDEKLSINKHKLNKLKTQYNAKIDSVRFLTSGELQDFFSERYGK